MESTSSNILKRYSILVEFLGEMLGPDYEIALHEITADSQSIIAIANGQISGRKVGAPITDLALKMLRDKVYETQDYVLNYKGISKSGKVFRSSTIFLKDEGNKLIGMLCINFDASRYLELSRQILDLCKIQPRGESIAETSSTLADTVERFPETIGETIENVMKNCLPEGGMYPEHLTQAEKIHIVDLLNRQGVFLLKGAVSQVAKHLRCSEPTIYRYLSTLNSED
jgi:predicted transcriptional regulator YheO